MLCPWPIIFVGILNQASSITLRPSVHCLCHLVHHGGRFSQRSPKSALPSEAHTITFPHCPCVTGNTKHFLTMKHPQVSAWWPWGELEWGPAFSVCLTHRLMSQTKKTSAWMETQMAGSWALTLSSQALPALGSAVPRNSHHCFFPRQQSPWTRGAHNTFCHQHSE